MPLTNAATVETFLGMTTAERSAIVQIVDSSGMTGSVCSGALVTPEWVLTAAHCMQIASPSVLMAGSAAQGSVAASVLATVAHPSLDVALLKIAIPSGAQATATPLAVEATLEPELAPGSRVELAGYGLTEAHVVGGLRFLVEAVSAIDSVSITVDGFGVNGACEGDSGGPLLIRGADGRVGIVGVLSQGDYSCLGTDTYARVDTVLSWVEGVVGSSPSGAGDCGALTSEGRCFGGVAVWCAGGSLSATPCNTSQKCGWNPAQSGYRCVSPKNDPCAGADSTGICAATVSIRCDKGVAQQMQCGCGDTCRYDGKTGQPYCMLLAGN